MSFHHIARSKEVKTLVHTKSFKHVGFISTRIAGTDGVSLEIEKWARVLEHNGYGCFYFSGENDRPPDKCMQVNEAHFQHPDILEIQNCCYGNRIRSRQATKRIHELRQYLKSQLYEFVQRFDIDLIIPENALAIPLNIPLGLALTEFIAELGFPTVAHHHDFSWERERFLVNGVEDYLTWAFPPNLPTMQHAVINSIASHQLSYRKGISNTIIPNVYDFANPPPATMSCPSHIKDRIGLSEKDFFILQPTRVVPRKWIERSLEIVNLMDVDNPVLVLSHSVNDEGDLYMERIREYARNLGVNLISIEHLVGPEEDYAPNGEKQFSIGDVYQCADLVCYPSGYEGFGNAFLETIYYRKPIVVNRYSIYIADIEPKGFDTITIEGFVGKQTMERISEVLTNTQRREQMVERNYQLGERYFSYEVLERLLLHLVNLLEIQCAVQP
ncbi:MAG: glycosyltransferase family 4 protein [Deltaproteobacteria bacterium]|nr:glycosyltransferase family 4 protein [Deltaproteobacteria bacterium]MCF8120083.1 glycosyltransferase family 4 protein [Deltaproteobacteria bacterium]